MLCLGGPLHGLHGRSAALRGVFGAVALLALAASPAFAQAPATGAISVVMKPEAQAVYLDGSAARWTHVRCRKPLTACHPPVAALYL